jgi:hypothetical protein
MDRLYEIVPAAHAECILGNLVRLASDPTHLSQRCPHPYPGTKTFDFECRRDEDAFSFRVHFFFNQEETQICVFDITVIPSP